MRCNVLTVFNKCIAIIKYKGETILNHLFPYINILKIVKYFFYFYFSLEILGEKKNNNNKIEKENSRELPASINGKDSINVLLFASFSFFLIIYNNCN